MSVPMNLVVDDVHKSFLKGGQTLEVLRGASLKVDAGERLAIVGQSGSGKSTFLHIIGTLDRPTRGRICMGPHDVFDRAPGEIDTLRNSTSALFFSSTTSFLTRTHCET